MGREAVRLALALVHGETVSNEVTVPTQVVFRRSCGCGANTWDETEELVRTIPPAAGYDEVRKRFATGFATLGSDGVFVNEDIAKELFEAIYSEIDTGVTGRFVRQLSELIRSNSPEQLVTWNRLNTVIMRALQAWVRLDATRRQRADEIARQIRAAIGDISELAQGTQRVKMKRLTLDLSETSRALIGSSNFDAIRSALNTQLPSLGIKTWYVSLYLDSSKPEDRSKLGFAYSSKDPSVAKSIGQEFPTRELVPFGSLFGEHRESLIMEPLFVDEEQIGMLTLGMGPDEGVIYEALRDLVSCAIRNSRLVERLEQLLQANPSQG
jgi:hypothetical protein